MRRSAALALIAILLNVTFLGACGDRGKQEKPLSVQGEKLYTVEGRIVGRDAAGNALRVDHKAIPGYMEAMTMDYPVRGATVQSLPSDNSRVTARLHVTDTAYWLTDVKQVP
jgi:protein SCO1/2